MNQSDKTKFKIMIFIQHFCSKQTIVTGFLAVLTGLLPTLYQNYKTIESRLLFICMYGVLFLLLFILGIMWIYRAAYPQEEIKRPKPTKREMLNTILNVFISWIGIILIEWLIQILFQNEWWKGLSKDSYVYIHRASLLNSLFYPLLAAFFLLPLFFVGMNVLAYGKKLVIILIKSYLILLIVCIIINYLSFVTRSDLLKMNMLGAIVATFFLWAITISTFLTIHKITEQNPI